MFSKFLVMVSFFIVSCGYQPQTDKNLAADGEPKPSTSTEQALTESSEIEVTGYIASIGITVDGVDYDDGEVFYTEELNRLEKVVEEEYPGYTLSLEADVGIRDLKRGMVAFLVSETDGFADESKVDSRGKFNFYVPKTVVEDEYMIRAYKRIGLRLSPPTDNEKEIYWCYNLYAERTKNLKNASVILRDFTTRITRYQCAATGSSGLQIPAVKSSVQEEIDDDPSLTSEEIADIKNNLNQTLPVEESSENLENLENNSETNNP